MTLIEVLIAIFVLGVGILSIVTLMTKNIANTQKIHTQNTALILAREGMEMLYNYRDTNHILGYERNCAHTTLEGVGDDQTAVCTAYFGSGETQYRTIDGSAHTDTKVKISGLDPQTNSFASLWSGSRLFSQGDDTDTTVHYDSYTHNTSGMPTAYARYLTFTGLSDIPEGSPITSHDIFKVQSVVLYNQGGYTGQISLSSFVASPE